MTDAETPVLAWHFVGNTLRDGRPVPADGEWLEHDGALVMCESGLHASIRLIDALRYAPGATVCRVEVAGEILYDYDKLVARKRRVLWRVDGENVLRAFARWSALQVAHLWPMPAVVREYLETGDEALRDAADAAAWDAAEATADATAWAAVWAAARNAAWAAARDAAWDAAWDAAESAAWYAAWYAACYAARAAARAAAWDEQNEQLERMVEEARQGRIEWVWQAAQEPRQ